MLKMNHSLRCHCRGYERKNLCDIWKGELDNFVTRSKAESGHLEMFHNCTFKQLFFN